MNMRIAAVLLLLFFCSPPHWTSAIVPDAQSIPDAAVPVPGSLAVTDALGVRVLSHRGEWTVFASMGGDAESIFLITGQIENISGKPLSYVKFQFELLGEDKAVVFRDYGYNRKAEALRDEEYEAGKKTFEVMEIESIGTGTQDGFRFLFFKREVPEFHSYRIRVIESR
jgi:hypothetical protein